jgi:ABC-type bacteriocin/lantibiotic exporter with double-glycine peptidase domain
VSARIEPGQRVAIVGSTGSGKTTLGMLLLGLYSPTSGEISFDGHAAADIVPRELRAQFGVVLQEPFVFSGTISDNIALHDQSLSQRDIADAARLACLHEDIAATPNAYATHLAQRGVGLSGGQRQRLAIARALARRPSVLLLDEATSHLDAVTESQVHANLAALRCTQIIIAHRLSTVRDADQILVLHEGRLVETGTNDQLLAHGGYYAALVRAQTDEPRAVAPDEDAAVAVDDVLRPSPQTSSPSHARRMGNKTREGGDTHGGDHPGTVRGRA